MHVQIFSVAELCHKFTLQLVERKQVSSHFSLGNGVHVVGHVEQFYLNVCKCYFHTDECEFCLLHCECLWLRHVYPYTFSKSFVFMYYIMSVRYFLIDCALVKVLSLYLYFCLFLEVGLKGELDFMIYIKSIHTCTCWRSSLNSKGLYSCYIDINHYFSPSEVLPFCVKQSVRHRSTQQFWRQSIQIFVR